MPGLIDARFISRKAPNARVPENCLKKFNPPLTSRGLLACYFACLFIYEYLFLQAKTQSREHGCRKERRGRIAPDANTGFPLSSSIGHSATDFQRSAAFWAFLIPRGRAGV